MPMNRPMPPQAGNRQMPAMPPQAAGQPMGGQMPTLPPQAAPQAMEAMGNKPTFKKGGLVKGWGKAKGGKACKMY